MRFRSPNAFACLLVIALDGRPIETSQHVVIKMVTQAENTGQVLVRTKTGLGDGFEYALNAPGKAPVTTLGRKAKQPVQVWLNGAAEKSRPTLALWMENGTWEMDIRNGRITLDCDTRDMDGEIAGQSFKTSERLVEVPARDPHPVTLNAN